MQPGEEHPRDVAADDDQRPVGQVDDVEHAPNQAEPHANRDVDASGQQAENDQLDEVRQGLAPLVRHRWSQAGVGYIGCASATSDG